MKGFERIIETCSCFVHLVEATLSSRILWCRVACLCSVHASGVIRSCSIVLVSRL